MKTRALALGMAAAMALGPMASAHADPDRYDGGVARYAYAKVIRVEPLVHVVDVS